MKTKISVDGQELPLNPFVADLVGNVVKGIVSSLKTGANEIKKIEVHLQEQQIASLKLNDQPISLEMTTGFARRIVGNTLKGMLQPLKGVEGGKDVIIQVEDGVV